MNKPRIPHCYGKTNKGKPCQSKLGLRKLSNGRWLCSKHDPQRRKPKPAKEPRPKRKKRPPTPPVDLESARTYLSWIAQELAAKRLDPKVASEMIKATNALVRVHQLVDHEKRLAALEKAAAKTGRKQ